MSIEYISGTPVPSSEIPDDIRQRISPDAPRQTKMLIARAVVPMPPEQLGIALAILVRDKDKEISETAIASLHDMPTNVVDGLMSNARLSGAVLDVFAHLFQDEWRRLQRLVANRSAYDETIRWMARKLKGNILDVIASNQVRVVREPEIIVALVKNSATPTPLLARVLETAIRNGVDTTRIPGFKQLAEAFFGDTSDMAGEAGLKTAQEEAAAAAEVAQAPAAEPEPELDPEFEPEPSETNEAEDGLQALLTRNDDESTSRAAAVREEPEEPEEPKEEEKEKRRGKPLFKLIEEMNVPQKVRLALMGDASARKILVRDKVRVVSEAVMKSPKLTDKEVSKFVLDKAISGDIIRVISKNREYTRNYAIMMALIYNPKTPPPLATGFIRNLRRKDLQKLLRAKGVPSYVNRAARAVKERRGSM
jgi:hypothetical protein